MPDGYVVLNGEEVLLSDLIEAVEKAGLVVVPVEPTPAMKNAACEAHFDANKDAIDAPGATDEAIWAAMIAARSAS